MFCCRKLFHRALRTNFSRSACILVLFTAALPLNAGAPDKHTLPDRQTLLDGARLHYRTYGTGTTAVVFVHGWACDGSFWHEQIAAFSQKWRVIVLDLPGHGESEAAKVEYTPDYLARGVDAVLRDAGVNHAFLVAHSMGMLVARHYMDRHSKKVMGVVNVDSRSLFYGEPDDTGQAERIMRARGLQGLDSVKVWRERIDRFFVPETPKRVRDEVQEKMPRTDAFVAGNALANLNRTKAWSRFPTPIPALAIYAEPPPVNNESRLRRVFSNLQYEAWSGVGHFVMLEKADDFNKRVMLFIQEVQQSSVRR